MYLEREIEQYIQEICKKVGPRPPCSKKEAELAELFRVKLEGLRSDVHIEKFFTHPGAYKVSFRLPIFFYFLSIGLFWYFPLLSLIFSLFGFLILFGEMSLSKEVIDIFFPKKESKNVICKIKPSNPAKDLLIIGSHLDSNWEFPLIRRLKNKFMWIIAFNIFLNGLLLVMISLKNILILMQIDNTLSIIESTFFIILLILSPIPIIQLLFIISNRPVMGANDNLSGMAVCYEIVKFLKSSEFKLKNLEVWICAFGCEEIGSKGSKAFIRDHFDDIKNAKVINLDMIGCKNGEIIIGTSEISGIVKLDKKIVKIIHNSARECNIKVKTNSLMGFTDSLSFARRNISAASIISLPVNMMEFYYHTRDDVIENLSYENIINVYKICVRIIKNLDC